MPSVFFGLTDSNKGLRRYTSLFFMLVLFGKICHATIFFPKLTLKQTPNLDVGRRKRYDKRMH